MLRFVTKYTPNVLAIYDPLTNQGIRMLNHATALARVGAGNAGWVQYDAIKDQKNLDYDVLFVQQSVLESVQELVANTSRIVIVDLNGAVLPADLIPHIHGYTVEHSGQAGYASVAQKPLQGLDTFIDIPGWPVTRGKQPPRFGIPPGTLYAEDPQEIAQLIHKIAEAIPEVPFLLPVELSTFLPASEQTSYYDPPTSAYDRRDIYRQITIGLVPGSNQVQKTMLPILECGASRIPLVASKLYSQLLSSPTLGALVTTNEEWVREAQKLIQQEGLGVRRSSAFYEKIAARRSLLRGSFYVNETFSLLYKQIIGAFLKTEAA